MECSSTPRPLNYKKVSMSGTQLIWTTKQKLLRARCHAQSIICRVNWHSFAAPYRNIADFFRPSSIFQKLRCISLRNWNQCPSYTIPFSSNTFYLLNHSGHSEHRRSIAKMPSSRSTESWGTLIFIWKTLRQLYLSILFGYFSSSVYFWGSSKVIGVSFKNGHWLMLEAYQPQVVSLFKRSFEQHYSHYAVRVTLPRLLVFLAKRRDTLELAKSRIIKAIKRHGRVTTFIEDGGIYI